MKIVSTVQEALNTFEAGAVGIYEDTYMDQVNPDYIILETADELVKFEGLVGAVRKASGTPAVLAALAELELFLDRPAETTHLFVLYKDGRWLVSFEELLDDEFDRQQQEADADWFEAQREHFTAEKAPVVADDPWRDKVVGLATEIAAAEGRAPEQADFNTAIIRLHDEVPADELGYLQRDLEAVEAGTSSEGLTTVFGLRKPSPFCDGCGFVVEECICNELVVCPSCGERVWYDYRCGACGADLEEL